MLLLLYKFCSLFLIINTCLAQSSETARCRGNHEYYTCGGACDNECETLEFQNQTNCPIVNIKCNDMCYCEQGYARNDKKECIPIDQCNSPKCEGPNEYFSSCVIHCPPETCLSLVARFKCPEPICTKGCKCRDGFLRKDKDSPCMPLEQCPQMANL